MGAAVMGRLLRDDPHARPWAILSACVIGLVIVGQGNVLTLSTAFSTFETFATIGLVALGLGLTMLIREFDLSVAGVYGMAGCIAVLTGGGNPWLGVLLAVLAGVAAGVLQGAIIVTFRLGSVGVSLGGLLVTSGIAYVLTESHSIPYSDMDVALLLGNRIAGAFSIRSLVAIAIFLAAAGVIGFTRLGRDIIATGSDRHAAVVAGVSTSAIIIGAFAFSGACAALSGALLSYSLASASPAGVADVLVPATTAAIIGGVSLGGGSGRPLGIAAGVLVLGVLRAGLNAIGVAPFVNDLVTGIVLLAVTMLDAPYFLRLLRSRIRLQHSSDAT
jgi:ribose/xylose/arabinose/galactoside ABC-type transport system permease subunit